MTVLRTLDWSPKRRQLQILITDYAAANVAIAFDPKMSENRQAVLEDELIEAHEALQQFLDKEFP